MFNAIGRPQLAHVHGRLVALMAMLVLFVCPLVFAQGGASGESVITNIRTSGSGSEMTIFIETSRRPAYSVFARSSPSRLVVDLAETVPGAFVSPISVRRGSVGEITPKEHRDASGVITRVTISLDGVVDYTSEAEENGLRLTIRPKAGGGSEEDVEDVLGAEIAGLGATSPSPSEQVEELVLAADSRSVRSGSASPDPYVEIAPIDEGGTNTVLGLDFLPYEKMSQVRVTASRPVKYSIGQVGDDKQLVVDLTDVFIPDRFRRPLDTSEFPSAVKMVSLYPIKSRPGDARLVIKLREKTVPAVDVRGNILYLQFTTPQSVLAGLPTNAIGQPLSGMSTAPLSDSGMAPSGLAPIRLSDGSSASSQPIGAPAVMNGAASEPFGGVTDGQNVNYTGRRISIDVREADLHNLFRMIANVSKLNIVASDKVKGKVTVKLVNVPWDQALDVILKSQGLGYERSGNILRIAPLKDLFVEREERLKAIKANEVLEPLLVEILPLSYANAKDVEKQVADALSERGTVSVDTRTNALIVKDISSNLAKAKMLALQLDSATTQVLIEARIVEVSTAHLKNLGIQWGGFVNGAPATGVNTGLFFPNSILASGGTSTAGGTLLASATEPNWVVDLPSANVAGSLSLQLGSITDIVGLDVRLSALERFGEGRVISCPKILTVDNKAAAVSQGTKIPYATVSASGTSIQLIEAVLKLQVTPHITPDNRVFLKVDVSNNRPDFSQQVNGQPAIEVKEATTEVMVRSGDTTVLGGVYTINESVATTGVPALMKVPLIGWLFKNKLTESSRKELLVFITPHIVKGGSPIKP